MFISKEKGLRAEMNVGTQSISWIWTSAICNLPLAFSTNYDHFQRQSDFNVCTMLLICVGNHNRLCLKVFELLQIDDKS